MLEVQNLSVAYGDVHVLHGVTLRVGRGEIVSLVGANGAGKTTALRAVSGLLPVLEGAVAFDGEPITGLAPSRIVARGLAHVPEGRQLFTNMSVQDNLEMGAYLPAARAELAKTLAWVTALFPRLGERRTQQAGTLSGGEQQMLAIARALMSRPRLLILDEPSLGLAPIMVKTIFEAIARINAEGTTVLLVEQNLAQSLRLSHRGYVLETGRIVLQGTGAELLANPHTRKAFLGV
ncbi:MAG TPA: ABC transporter ATP-binding protein [Methylomirabilota bacterium]|nr:ABC transporter ATP-binding protein [Methylomirabilota bacterium]